MPRTIVGIEQAYDWGDPVTLREMRAMEPGRVAEIWYGTHPRGAARLDHDAGPLLSDVTGEMTMLVKLLSCAEPLSLQTHPTREQARSGFAREEAAGIDVDSPTRLYRDPSDKPEMLVALGDFEALCGFADTAGTLTRLRAMGWHDEAAILAERGTLGYLRWSFAHRSAPDLALAPRWLLRIADLHPNDPGLRVAPLLNHVVLRAGEALCLPAGNLHAYLHGTGLEVMSSSDNVVRAGFTTKHVDVDELLNIVDVAPLASPVVRPDRDGAWWRYRSPSHTFDVARVERATVPADGCHRIVAFLDERPINVVHLGPRESLDVPTTAWVCTQHATAPD